MSLRLWKCVTSSLMMVALLSDLSADVIFLPRSANTMMTSELKDQDKDVFNR